jgi:hypothetical protein
MKSSLDKLFSGSGEERVQMQELFVVEVRFDDEHHEWGGFSASRQFAEHAAQKVMQENPEAMVQVSTWWRRPE